MTLEVQLTVSWSREVDNEVQLTFEALSNAQRAVARRGDMNEPTRAAQPVVDLQVYLPPSSIVTAETRCCLVDDPQHVDLLQGRRPYSAPNFTGTWRRNDAYHRTESHLWTCNDCFGGILRPVGADPLAAG